MLPNTLRVVTSLFFIVLIRNGDDTVSERTRRIH